MNLFNLSGKNAIVTGSARGLGQAIAVGLAEAGANIVLVTNQSPAEATKALVEATGQKAIIVTADVSNQADLPRIISEAKRAFHTIDILVNNAGIIRRTPASDFAFSDWQEVLATNLDSVFTLCQLAGREMIAQESGKIINIASMLSFQGGINVPAYTASKHAVVGLTKALANEWASKGIQVNAIAPGYMETDNTAALRVDESRNRAILERIPAGRWGASDDLKGASIFLSSRASDYVNGHILCVDGGWMNR